MPLSWGATIYRQKIRHLLIIHHSLLIISIFMAKRKRIIKSCRRQFHGHMEEEECSPFLGKSKLKIIRGVDNFFEVGGLGVRVIPHATRGVWGHAPPGNFWLFRALRLLLVQSHWWKAS